MQLETARLVADELRLGWRGPHPALVLPLVWLRDHCPCRECLHPETGQRLLETAAIPADLVAGSVTLEDEGRALAIVWAHDGHHSRYDSGFLGALRENPEHLPLERELWDARHIGRLAPSVPYDALMRADDVLLEFLEKLARFGLCWVEGVPATPEATIAAAERVAYIRVTIFGGYYDFTANLEHKDTAYTSLAIGPHTDGTYALDAPGYQMFHCLAAECTGGDSVLIDGFKVAELLREQHPLDYRTLTEVGVPGQYLDPTRGIQLMARRPLLRLDAAGELVQVSYNNHDRAPFVLPPAEHRRFYRALGTFAALCARPDLQYRRRLLPGSIVFFDNWRLLHARDAYVGYRRLAGSYHNKEDVESRLRVLRSRAARAL